MNLANPLIDESFWNKDVLNEHIKALDFHAGDLESAIHAWERIKESRSDGLSGRIAPLDVETRIARLRARLAAVRAEHDSLTTFRRTSS